MKPLMIVVASLALAGAVVAQTAPEAPSGRGGIEITPAAQATMIDAPENAKPALSRDWTASWVIGRSIFATGQPSGSAWQTAEVVETLPADWLQIATVKDIVLDETGQLSGYITDIGGFLGIGAKEVLLEPEALHLVKLGDNMVVATNFTREEMQALPGFDESAVLR